MSALVRAGHAKERTQEKAQILLGAQAADIHGDDRVIGQSDLAPGHSLRIRIRGEVDAVWDHADRVLDAKVTHDKRSRMTTATPGEGAITRSQRWHRLGMKVRTKVSPIASGTPGR